MLKTAVKVIYGAVAAVAILGAPALAQNYPARPVRLLVPFAPGGGTDLVARSLAGKMGESLGTTMVVDNRPGANANIGNELAARAMPDGYTLIMTSSALAINPNLHRKLPYDPIKDFAPISLATNVPYKGTGAALIDLLGNHIQVYWATMPPTLPHIKAGRLKGLAVGSLKRAKAIPELTTVAELGYPGYEAGSWFGMLAPAGTPGAIVARLNKEVNKALAAPELNERLSAEGAEPAGNTPDEFAAFIKAEIVNWGKVAKAAGIEPQ